MGGMDDALDGREDTMDRQEEDTVYRECNPMDM